jgi:hypothetical protein
VRARRAFVAASIHTLRRPDVVDVLVKEPALSTELAMAWRQDADPRLLEGFLEVVRQRTSRRPARVPPF